jgi:hypothetical protein
MMNKGKKEMKKNKDTKFKVKGPEAIEDEVIVKAGSTYTGNGQTTTTAGSVVLKPQWGVKMK